VCGSLQDLIKTKTNVIELKETIEERDQEIRRLSAAVSAATEAAKSAEGPSTDERVAKLAQELEEAVGENADLRKALQSTQSDFAQQLEESQKLHTEELVRVEEARVAERKALLAELEKVQQQATALSATAEALRSPTHDLEALHAAHNDKLREVETAHREQLDNVRADAEAEIKKLRVELESAKLELKFHEEDAAAE
jgi:predicted  nucleic acid-binding Zn-ribbon protein